MRARVRSPFAAYFPAVLAAVTLLFLVYSLWELLRLHFFAELDAATVHWLYVSRGAVSATILAAWAAWYVLRHRALFERRLHRTELRCRGLIGSLPDAVISLDPAGRIEEWNPGAERLFDLAAAGVRGRTLADLGEEWAPELSEVISVAAAGRRVSPFLTRRRTHRGVLKEIEFRVSAIQSGDGIAPGMAVVARDLTEPRRVEGRLRDMEKLAGVGRLAAGIAHQLGSPLSTIGLNARMIVERAGDPDVHEDATVIVDASEHCRAVVGELLRFARPSAGARRRLRLGPLVSSVLHMVESEMKEAGIRLSSEADHDAEVVADANQIEQVLLNLLTNARQATPPGGDVRVRVSIDAPAGVLVEVSDTGHGIAESDFPRVFEPFFTTREAAGGTGLGLAVCYRIVQEHGGALSVESSPGCGACFTVWLPAAAERPA